MTFPALLDEGDAAAGAGPLAGWILLGLGLALAPTGLRVLRRLGPTPTPPARWGAVHAGLAVAAALLVLAGGAALVDAKDVLGALLVTAAMLVAAATAALVGARAAQVDGLAALGFPPAGNGRGLAAGLLAYLLAVPGLLGVGGVWPAVARWIGIDASGTQEVLAGIAGLSGPALVIAMGIACVLGPLCEEIVFRGLFQPVLTRRLGVAGGIAATSFAFALLHGAVAFLPIFALSLWLGAVRERTGRIAACWGVHTLHNTFTLAVALAARDQILAG